MIDNNWIEHLPLKAKSQSGPENCSFLTQKNNIYIMDNHRLALWCWKHFLGEKNNKFNFFHLDAHEDAKADLSPAVWEEINFLSLQEYMDLNSKEGNYKKIRWDNYLPVYIHPDQKQIRKSVFATHSVGINGFAHCRISPYGLISDFPKLFVDELKWIINLDLDYFYPKEIKAAPLFSTEFIKSFFRALKHQYDEGDIELITVALSPECCGSWENSTKILKIFDEIFELNVNVIKGLIESENRS